MKSDMTRALVLTLEEEEARVLYNLFSSLKDTEDIPKYALPFVNQLMDYLDF